MHGWVNELSCKARATHWQWTVDRTSESTSLVPQVMGPPFLPDSSHQTHVKNYPFSFSFHSDCSSSMHASMLTCSHSGKKTSIARVLLFLTEERNRQLASAEPMLQLSWSTGSYHCASTCDMHLPVALACGRDMLHPYWSSTFSCASA